MINKIVIDKELDVTAELFNRDTVSTTGLGTGVLFYKLSAKDISFPIEFIRVYSSFSRAVHLEGLVKHHSKKEDFFYNLNDQEREASCKKYLQDIIVPEEVIKAGKNLIALHKNPRLIPYKTGKTYNSYGLNVNNINVEEVSSIFDDITFNYWKDGNGIEITKDLVTPLEAGKHVTVFCPVEYTEFKEYLVCINLDAAGGIPKSFNHGLNYSTPIAITAAYSNCQLAYIENAERLLHLKEPQKFIKLMDAFGSTLYYIHLATSRRFQLINIFKKGGYEVVGEMQQISTKESTQNHYLLQKV